MTLSSLSAFLGMLLLGLSSAFSVSSRCAGQNLSIPNDWEALAIDRIEQEEYQFSRTGNQLWRASNRAQEFQSQISMGGIKILSMNTDDMALRGRWALRLRTHAFGRLGELQETACTSIQMSGDQARLDFGRFDAWYTNDARGIKQGWSIAQRPGGSAPLVIEVSIQGDLKLRIGRDRQNGVLVDSRGEQRLWYKGLRAWDAVGRELNASLHASDQGVQIRVHDMGAIYPIQVDPVISDAAWSVESDQVGASLGYSVASAGDVNGDGFSDVIIGAGAYDNGLANQGRAWVYMGSAAGLSLTPGWIAEADQAGATFGLSVAGAGDVNGDGFDDVLVGARFYSNGEQYEGRAFLYLGSSTGLGSTADWTAESDQADAYFGTSVAAAGDVNADGFDDVIIGAPNYDSTGFADGGRAYVFLGSSAGLQAVAVWTEDSPKLNSYLGASVATAGDVNGDGYADVVIGSYNYPNGGSLGISGRVLIFHGSASGPESLPGAILVGPQTRARFGTSVASAGDVNGDGFSDVIVGCPFYDLNPADSFLGNGRAFVYHGSAGGISAPASWMTDPVDLGFSQPGFGESVASAGDLNGNGFSDVIIGYPTWSNPENNEGRAYAFEGSANGLAAVEVWKSESNQPFATRGFSVAGAGDVNGDGFGDVIVGSPNYGNPEFSAGRALVFHGAPTLASGSIINGSGINPLCLSSHPPVIGKLWESTIDTTVLGAAVSAVLVVRAQAASGTFLAGGELLLNLGSSLFSSEFQPASGIMTAFRLPVPASPALAGLNATAQGVILGGSFQLCNGYSFTVGY